MGEASGRGSGGLAGALVGRPLAEGRFAEAEREKLVERALELADEVAARVRVPWSARRRASRLDRLVTSPGGLDFTVALTDQVARIAGGRRSVARLRSLVSEDGPPSFAGTLDRLGLKAGLVAGSVVPGVVADLVRARVRQESASIVLRAGDRRMARHSARRAAEGIDLNYNILGEAILGQEAADERRDQIVHLCRLGFVDYVSVKASAVCPRISAYAFDDSLARVTAGLRPILVAAVARRPAVFVNLDMEEYRDLELTLTAFRALLEEPALAGMDAGIVLHAYLPESHAALEDLAGWARRRYSETGGTTRVRLVKGANLGMELVEAELHGWVAATYPTKADVDVSYKRLVERALDPSWGPGLRVGLASHNLFDVAWGLVVAADLG
ncbi:MAG: proline dehydrogenase family protein, partial [Acidimicrobiales bacterium]